MAGDTLRFAVSTEGSDVEYVTVFERGGATLRAEAGAEAEFLSRIGSLEQYFDKARTRSCRS